MLGEHDEDSLGHPHYNRFIQTFKEMKIVICSLCEENVDDRQHTHKHSTLFESGFDIEQFPYDASSYVEEFVFKTCV